MAKRDLHNILFPKQVLAGDPGVAIGTYLKVMAVLGMESNFAEMAAHDEVGIKLQNIKLLEGSR